MNLSKKLFPFRYNDILNDNDIFTKHIELFCKNTMLFHIRFLYLLRIFEKHRGTIYNIFFSLMNIV